MPHDVADDQDRRVLWSFSHEVEVAADALRGRQEGRGELHTGTLGELGWRQRVTNRAQVRELAFGRVEPFAQIGQVMLTDVGF